MRVKFYITYLLGEIEFYKWFNFREVSTWLVFLIGMIVRMWLALFLYRYKWYQSQLITPCGICLELALYDVTLIKTSEV
jgi:hypothetical protein